MAKAEVTLKLDPDEHRLLVEAVEETIDRTTKLLVERETQPKLRTKARAKAMGLADLRKAL